MNHNDEKVKRILENVEVPDEVSPENMKKMLDKKATAKKRSSRISMTGRITATAAACAVIVGATVGTTGLINRHKDKPADSGIMTDATTSPTNPITTEIVTSPAVEINASYMNGAESYEQIFKLMKTASEKRSDFIYTQTNGNFIFDDVMEEETFDESLKAEAPADDMPAGIGGMGGGDDSLSTPIIAPAPTETSVTTVSDTTETTTEIVTIATTEQTTEATTTATSAETATNTDTETTAETTTDVTTTTTAEEDFSETYNQEEYVLEADIVKTDGQRIYYIYNGDYNEESCSAYMNIASVDKGKITDTYTLELFSDMKQNDDNSYSDVFIEDMYIYNDMIAVIGFSNTYDDYSNINSTFVSFYTKDAEPQFIGTYTQDGYYNDVRITPDGYMYLTTNHTVTSFDNIETSDDIEAFIPRCGVGQPQCIEPADILLPEEELDIYDYMSYTVIGSINLTQSGEFTPCDTKALAGYTGTHYVSENNLYITSGRDETSITRISVNQGQIIPQASGKVDGFVKDQFSLSEYNGYLRVATTVDKWVDNGNFIKDVLDIPYESYRLNENYLYILDMDMNVVGKVEGFGKDESIKSVSFSGNMGYVVTYEQTDPLFAFDLSDPANPVITDDFKILGYSTYMQNWGDGLLFGFGADADENGIENGIKLAMFDNSDPYNLAEVGLYPIHNSDYEYVYSIGMYERKALLIAPEKNIIGIPVDITKYTADYNYIGTEYKYMFFSYENGEFILKGELSTEELDSNFGLNSSFNRAIYIGDYVYAISGNCIISADIETLTETDRFYFN